MTSLYNHIQISGRYLRSIRLDTDLADSSALEGFICSQSFKNVLTAMARHLSETGQGAFTWTGPYGSGKSSLAVALSALLDGNTSTRAKTVEIFGNELVETIRESLPSGSEAWRVVPVVGVRDDPVKVIGEAVRQSGVVKRRPRGGWSVSNLIGTISKAADINSDRHGGLIIFIDEMGKFLEASVRDGFDIYVFQQLAEAATRSKGRLLVVGILHQSFAEYTNRLSHEMRDEWTKVQGRFIDLVVDATGDEQVELISRAIKNTHQIENKYMVGLCTSIASASQKHNETRTELFASKLSDCWPLHPIVTCLIGPISRRRFGQNQRSIFGFLSSVEQFGFQDFLERH